MFGFKILHGIFIIALVKSFYFPHFECRKYSSSTIEEPTTGEWLQETLNAHNNYRSRHQVPPLNLNQSLVDSAQQCAEYMASIQKRGHVCKEKYGIRVGESLSITGYLKAPSAHGPNATARWYSEERFYNYDTGESFGKNSTGHFTQVVWKNSNSVGFGIGRNGSAYQVLVAQYYPPGNVQTQYLQNVFRPVTAKDK